MSDSIAGALGSALIMGLIVAYVLQRRHARATRVANAALMPFSPHIPSSAPAPSTNWGAPIVFVALLYGAATHRGSLWGVLWQLVFAAFVFVGAYSAFSDKEWEEEAKRKRGRTRRQHMIVHTVPYVLIPSIGWMVAIPVGWTPGVLIPAVPWILLAAIEGIFRVWMRVDAGDPKRWPGTGAGPVTENSQFLAIYEKGKDVAALALIFRFARRMEPTVSSISSGWTSRGEHAPQSITLVRDSIKIAIVFDSVARTLELQGRSLALNDANVVMCVIDENGAIVGDVQLLRADLPPSRNQMTADNGFLDVPGVREFVA